MPTAPRRRIRHLAPRPRRADARFGRRCHRGQRAGRPDRFDSTLSPPRSGPRLSPRPQGRDPFESGPHRLAKARAVPLPTALELPVFQGPLDLLLTLIERRRLEITDVSAAAV